MLTVVAWTYNFAMLDVAPPMLTTSVFVVRNTKPTLFEVVALVHPAAVPDAAGIQSKPTP